MVEIGYFLSSEEHPPGELVRQARRAEQLGIERVWISDHFHPWLDSQGQSPFVWSVIGGIAATTSLHIGTAVTCPTFRVHPAIVAQAAATSAVMTDGRFELGVGSGEQLNEHVLGDRWPPADIRLGMLEEAVEVIRLLWSGDEITHRGRYYTVENARLYTVPDTPPAVLVSAFGPSAARLAGRIGDGFVSTSPAADALARFREFGGTGPASGTLKLCWATDRDRAVETAHRLWRTGGVPGELSQELRTPALFEQASELVTPEAIAEHMPCGPDPAPIVAEVRKYVDAGFERVYLNQIGSDQDAFFDFYERELRSAIDDAVGITTTRREPVAAST